MEEERKPVEKAEEMDQEKKDDILKNYDKFLSYLGSQVSKGEKLGMGEDQLATAAKKLGDYLAKVEEPRNREENVLKELWTVAENDEEKSNLARLLVRLAQQKNKE